MVPCPRVTGLNGCAFPIPTVMCYNLTPVWGHSDMGDGIFEGWLGHDSCPIRKISALIKEAQGNFFVHFPTWSHLAGAIYEK